MTGPGPRGLACLIAANDLTRDVLFPKVLLPLRIFEPRYKLMLKEVLDTAGWLAMGLRRGRRELDKKGHPDVYPVAGVGRLGRLRAAAGHRPRCW